MGGLNKIGKTVPLTLVGLDGNAFCLLGAFIKAAKKAKWDAAEIDAVVADAKSGDYDHLLCVLMAHCDDGGV